LRTKRELRATALLSALNLLAASSSNLLAFVFVIPAQAVRPIMQKMNEDLERAAKDSGAVFLDAPLNVHWESSDFLDPMHFAPVGAAKFAETIAPGIAMNCQ
jgi:hypothetical protein